MLLLRLKCVITLMVTIYQALPVCFSLYTVLISLFPTFYEFFFYFSQKGRKKNGGECLNFPILAAPTTTRGWSRSSSDQLFNSLKLSCIRYYPMATTPIERHGIHPALQELAAVYISISAYRPI